MYQSDAQIGNCSDIRQGEERYSMYKTIASKAIKINLNAPFKYDGNYDVQEESKNQQWE